MGYSDWKEEIVNWIPKEEGNPDINKRRPLMYYEVLRKMCIGIRVRRVLVYLSTVLHLVKKGCWWFGLAAWAGC